MFDPMDLDGCKGIHRVTRPVVPIAVGPVETGVITMTLGMVAEAFGKVPVNIGKIVGKQSHHWFISRFKIMGIKNNPVEIEGEAAESPDNAFISDIVWSRPLKSCAMRGNIDRRNVEDQTQQQASDLPKV